MTGDREDVATPPDLSPRPSIALVLGAGGVPGVAFLAGALAGLTEATGWDARSAQLVVGTSAGAGTAAWLRIGLSGPDLAARALGQALSPQGAALSAGLPRAGRYPPDPTPAGGLHQAVRASLPAAPWLAGAAVLPLGHPRPVVALAGLLPRGRRPTEMLGTRIAAAHPARWPDAPTWVCAVRLRDGSRVVFGRDDVGVPRLEEAVRASSAVPGLMAPVTIAGSTYVDGGVHSTTNADLAAGLGFDLVVVIPPMTATPAALRGGRTDISRMWHSRVLAREVARIRAHGTEALVIQPTAADLVARSPDALDASQSPAVTRQARTSAVARLDRPEARVARELLLRCAASEAPAT